MNMFRIVQKRTNKGMRGNSPYREVGSILLFVFLLPYVISCLWGHIGEETKLFINNTADESIGIDERYEIGLSQSWGIRRLNMREYLTYKLEVIMPRLEDGSMQYELEALKAQAVLLRTELWRLFVNNDALIIVQDDAVLYNRNETLDLDENTLLYEQAVRETDGIFLAYEGKPVKAAFFPVSGGQTRNADEIFGNNEYPYLVNVECSQDIQADNFQTQKTIPREEYCLLISELFEIEDKSQELWEIPEFTYDSTGYVTEVWFHGNKCSGETFRTKLELNSACFQVQQLDDSVVFHVKGVGHGFGMSQYDANKRAAAGESFDQILKNYFFNTELAKIE